MEFYIGFDASQGGQVTFKCSVKPKAGQESLVDQFIQCQVLSLFVGQQPYLDLATKQGDEYTHSCKIGFPIRCSKPIDSCRLRQNIRAGFSSSTSTSHSSCEIRPPSIHRPPKCSPLRPENPFQRFRAGLSQETIAEDDVYEPNLPQQGDVASRVAQTQQRLRLRDWFKRPPSVVMQPETPTQYFDFDGVQSARRNADNPSQDVAVNVSNHHGCDFVHE
jgi:hypothetical protein